MTEADEPLLQLEDPAVRRARALLNVAHQYRAGESIGVIALYESAAINAGVTPAQIDSLRTQCREVNRAH